MKLSEVMYEACGLAIHDNEPLVTLPEAQVQGWAAEVEKIEKALEGWSPDQFTNESHDRTTRLEGSIVKALEGAGLDPCPAIKIAQQAVIEAWGVWRLFVAERDRLMASIRNQAGDNLCWLKDGVKIPPAPEFLESCRRYHAQIAGTVGVLGPECMTIAELEANNAHLRTQKDRFAFELAEIARTL